MLSPAPGVTLGLRSPSGGRHAPEATHALVDAPHEGAERVAPRSREGSCRSLPRPSPSRGRRGGANGTSAAFLPTRFSGMARRRDGDVAGPVDVRVHPGATVAAAEAFFVPVPLVDVAAVRECLARIGGVDIDDLDAEAPGHAFEAPPHRAPPTVCQQAVHPAREPHRAEVEPLDGQHAGAAERHEVVERAAHLRVINPRMLLTRSRQSALSRGLLPSRRILAASPSARATRGWSLPMKPRPTRSPRVTRRARVLQSRGRARLSQARSRASPRPPRGPQSRRPGSRRSSACSRA